MREQNKISPLVFYAEPLPCIGVKTPIYLFFVLFVPCVRNRGTVLFLSVFVGFVTVLFSAVFEKAENMSEII